MDKFIGMATASLLIGSGVSAMLLSVYNAMRPEQYISNAIVVISVLFFLTGTYLIGLGYRYFKAED